MPVSKQARSKQERQKDRLAREHAAREARRERRRRIAVIVVLALVVVVVLSTFAIASNGSNKKSTTPTTAPAPVTTADKNTPTTQSPGTAALASAAGKPCVATKGPLPKGAPNVPVQVGPPPTALIKQDLKEGTGAVVQPNAKVTANYIGVACSTGTIFDSSWKGGQPVQFGLDKVIPGWQQGIPGMKVGGQRLLGIPAAMAYGSAGFAPDIAPDESLWFVVDVVSSP